MKKVIRLTENKMIDLIKTIIKEEYTPEKENEYEKLKQERDSIKSQINDLRKRYNEINEKLEKIDIFYHPQLIVSFARGKYVGRVLVPSKYDSNMDEPKKYYITVLSTKDASEYSGKDDPELIKDLTNKIRKKSTDPNWLKKINFNPDDILFDKNIN